MKKERISNRYFITKKEFIRILSVTAATLFLAAKLFYDSFIFAIALIPIGVVLFKRQRIRFHNNRMRKRERQFKDMLLSVADSMGAGYSIENAVKESYRDLKQIYGYDSYICGELRMMISRLKLNVTPEIIFKDFAGRCMLESAELFAEMFAVAKQTGGNMPDIVRSVAENIRLKENVKEETDVLISEKALEQKIMTVIPMLLILYMKVTSPGFLDVMYDTWMGRIIMTVCLVIYTAAYVWSEKIVSVEL